MMLSKFQYYDQTESNYFFNASLNTTRKDAFRNESNKSRKILSPGWLEILISFWVFSFLCQEIEQVSYFISSNFFCICFVNEGSFFLQLQKLIQKDESVTFWKNIRNYVLDGWNQFDMLGILLFAIGMFLRFVSIKMNERVFILSR